ncbi:MAG TPA: DUF5666 domain-containing protein [Candidatus Limnocylindrales bacterium]|nr:DUF5666 domain-containing protein [Candidatus Limnocylindrales bacterium]
MATAQTLTPKPSVISPTVSEKLNEKLNTQINKLKDKIASRVSELNLVEKRGTTGVVTEVSTNKITLLDIQGNTKLIDIDEITKFSSSFAKGTFGLSDITKGTKINVLGLYNKQSKRILARFIRTAINPEFLSGTISDIDQKNFTISVATEGKKTQKVDIGTTTKISSYSSDGTTAKITFAKLSSGERVLVLGFPDQTDNTLLVASRVAVLPELPKDPRIEITITQPTPTASPTATLRRTAPVAPVVTSSVRRLTPTISPSR